MKTELEYIQRPKEEFKSDQLANNMPIGWDEKTNIVFEHMFDIGFENGMNWQKHQIKIDKENVIAKAKREYETGKIGFVQALEQVFDANN